MQLWTAAHAKTLLPALAVMVALTLILRRLLIKKSLRIRMIPFQILSALLVLLEIGKQLLSLRQGYDLYHIPLHFCSLFIFMMPLMSLYRGKHSQIVRGITTALCASVFLLMLIYPNLIYSANNIRQFFQNYFSFHTVVFHNIVVFAFLLIPALELYKPEKKGEWKSLQVFYLGFCAVSSVMAQVLQTNFNNFYQCNVPILESLRQAVQQSMGYGVSQVLYILIVTAVQSLFVQGAFWLCVLLCRNKKRRPSCKRGRLLLH